MLRVAVCDDDAAFRRQLGRAAGDVLFARTEYEIFYFEDGEAVRKCVQEGTFSCQLLLLDIHMGGMDGIRTARWLRRHRTDVDIIFVTVSKEHVYECYTYKAFAYLLKPVSPERFSAELNRYLDEIAESPEYLNVTVKGCEHRIALGRIVCFESDVRKIRLYQPDGEIEFYGKLGELEAMLEGHGFFRCHQSYLVNRRYITAVKRDRIELEGMEVPVSRKYQDAIREREQGRWERFQ